MKNIQKELFSFWVSSFLTVEIPVNRNLSFNTQKSYRDAFLIFIRFVEIKYKVNPAEFKIMDFNIDVVLNSAEIVWDDTAIRVKSNTFEMIFDLQKNGQDNTESFCKPLTQIPLMLAS